MDLKFSVGKEINIMTQSDRWFSPISFYSRDGILASHAHSENAHP